MSNYFEIISFLPIVVLLALSLWKGVKAGIYTSVVVAAILFFTSGSPLISFWASLISAFVGTVNILMIIFGAILLYHIMEVKGYVVEIKDSLAGIHPDPNFRFFFLAIFLTAFFESVAGFGTPGAIVPLLLISLGFSPVLSIAVVLLIDGLFAITGAIGTPVIAGLEGPLKLESESISWLYLYAAISIALAGIIIIAFVYYYLKKENGTPLGKHGWLLYSVIIIPFLCFSFYMRELSGIMASLFMAIFSYFFLFKNKRFNWKPWLPYLMLVVILVIPKMLTPLEEFLAWRINFKDILGTTISASMQPLRSPLVPFLLAASFALWRSGNFKLNYKPVIIKTTAVFAVLFPSLAITQLMMNSGSEDMPSMITAMSGVFVEAGDAFPFLSPFIGVLGAFITGSTTVSNIIFGPLQYNAANSLGFDTNIILSLQLAGASLGNAVCLFNIIAAGAVAGITDFNAVLKKNLLPVSLASLVIAICGYVLLAWT